MLEVGKQVKALPSGKCLYFSDTDLWLLQRMAQTQVELLKLLVTGLLDLKEETISKEVKLEDTIC